MLEFGTAMVVCEVSLLSSRNGLACVSGVGVFVRVV